MTTIGVAQAVGDRILPMNMPGYSYLYPSVSSVKLAAVKNGIYHPNLPSFRKMDMDTVSHKLHDEHSRSVTSCGPRDFKQSSSSLFNQPEKKLPSAGITETGRRLHRYYTTPRELREASINWSDFLNQCPERFNIRLPELPQDKDLKFRGYGVRYLRPEVATSWRYTLRQEPQLDQFSQRPIPANIYARYRESYPQSNRSISMDAWR